MLLPTTIDTMKTAEQQFEEVRKYLIENSTPEFQFVIEDDYFGEVVWRIGKLRYIEYLQIIENEDGETFSFVDEDFDNFEECISIRRLEEIFEKFPKSGYKDFFEYFKEETGYKTYRVEYNRSSSLFLDNKWVFMYIHRISDCDIQKMNYIYNQSISSIEKKKLEARHNISSQKTIPDAL